MYTRINSFQLDPANVEAALKIWEDHVAVIWRQQKGYVRGYALANSQSGKGVSVTVWESKEDSDAYSSKGAYATALAPLMSYFIGTPTAEGYDIEKEA